MTDHELIDHTARAMGIDLRDNPTWNPLADDAPDDGEFYLVWWRSRYGSEGMAVAQKLEPCWHIVTPWCGSNCYDHIGDITHWMPLPDPPTT